MSETNKTYRIHTNVNPENGTDPFITINLDSDYNTLEVLSLKIDTSNFYKLHTSDYGCLVGRVVANGGVGVPNAKISIFIEADDSETDPVIRDLYPFASAFEQIDGGIRYNLLPDTQVSVCHTPIGTFPSKRRVLDDPSVGKVYTRYYKYTTRSNDSGDYMIFGVPVGTQSLHCDIDLSDVGFLSQKPKDMIDKGYDMGQFDSAYKFKKAENIDILPQVITNDEVIYVYPFWGEEEENDIKITRADINVNYLFEPSCVFIGSIVTDEKSEGVSVNCNPSNNMGKMNKLISGAGTIEMIRKTIDGDVESFNVKGTQLIDSNGTWCYQIPMNLDYYMTDEYGNLVPSNDKSKGIPTRARVRFRVSMSQQNSTEDSQLVKVLVPNNPKSIDDLDYHFGTETKDDDFGTKSFRDLFWNNVYTVKSYIPRIQNGESQDKEGFTGIKQVNVSDGRNPIPYNNIRVNMTYMFTLQCALLKTMIRSVAFVNRMRFNSGGGSSGSGGGQQGYCTVIGDGLCPDLKNWYFAPGCDDSFLSKTVDVLKSGDTDDVQSVDYENRSIDTTSFCITNRIDHFMQCIELNLAMEHNVIQFDFYNDWINGMIYIPRWFARVQPKGMYVRPDTAGGNDKKYDSAMLYACSDEQYYFRRYVQQCSLSYAKDIYGHYTVVTTPQGCIDNKRQKCHEKAGRNHVTVFNGLNGGGFLHTEKTMKKENVYYFKPCEWLNDGTSDSRRCPMFATDIVMLGSLSEYNKMGIPTTLSGLTSTSYQLPPNIAETNIGSRQYMLGIGSNGIVCAGRKLFDNEPVEPMEPTFENYKKWSKNSSFYDRNPNDDLSEYPYTETAGIDWGYAGPGQSGKKNNLLDLYFPGGHFLGISCVNSAVNIKSCVNLSRACELGVSLSRIQVLPYRKDTSSKVDYAQLMPNGLINQYNVGNDDYRKIFATLNYNGLKTKVDPDTGYLVYDIKPLQPNGFNGDLSRYVSNSKNYNRHVNDGPMDFAFMSVIEEPDPDYYRFRMGVHDYDGKTPKIENKYLINNGGTVSMPVYDNSYYFYFGISNGNTAIERLFTDYYAECEKLTDDDNGMFTCTPYPTGICDETGGSVEIVINNVLPPYQVSIEKEMKDVDSQRLIYKTGYLKTMGEIPEDEFYHLSFLENQAEGYSDVINFNQNAFKIDGLSKGNYRITLHSEYTEAVSAGFYISEMLGGVDAGITFNGLNFDDDFEYIDRYRQIKTEQDCIDRVISLNGEVAYNGYIGIDGIVDGSKVEGVIIYTDTDFFSLGIRGRSLNLNNIEGFDIRNYQYYKDDFVVTCDIHRKTPYNDTDCIIYGDNTISLSVPAWRWNDTYNVGLVIKCNSTEYKLFRLGEATISLNVEIDYYVGDEDISFLRLIGRDGHDASDENDWNEGTYYTLYDRVEFPIESGKTWQSSMLDGSLTTHPLLIWKMLMGTLYRDSMYYGSPMGKMSIVPVTKNTPYKEKIGTEPERFYAVYEGDLAPYTSIEYSTYVSDVDRDAPQGFTFSPSSHYLPKGRFFYNRDSGEYLISEMLIYTRQTYPHVPYKDNIYNGFMAPSDRWGTIFRYGVGYEDDPNNLPDKYIKAMATIYYPFIAHTCLFMENGNTYSIRMALANAIPYNGKLSEFQVEVNKKVHDTAHDFLLRGNNTRMADFRNWYTDVPEQVKQKWTGLLYDDISLSNWMCAQEVKQHFFKRLGLGTQGSDGMNVVDKNGNIITDDIAGNRNRIIVRTLVQDGYPEEYDGGLQPSVIDTTATCMMPTFENGYFSDGVRFFVEKIKAFDTARRTRNVDYLYSYLDSIRQGHVNPHYEYYGECSVGYDQWCGMFGDWRFTDSISFLDITDYFDQTQSSIDFMATVALFGSVMAIYDPWTVNLPNSHIEENEYLLGPIEQPGTMAYEAYTVINACRGRVVSNGGNNPITIDDEFVESFKEAINKAVSMRPKYYYKGDMYTTVTPDTNITSIVRRYVFDPTDTWGRTHNL